MNSFGFATPMATPPRGDPRQRSVPPAKTIPFDYVFQFALQGVSRNKVQDVVEISSEGVFVALSVSYSLVLDERSTARTFQPVIDQRTTLHSPVFVPLFTEGGLEIPSENFVGFVLIGSPGTEMAVLHLDAETPSVIKPTDRIGADGTVFVDLIGRLPSPELILRVWDKTHSLLSELFQVAGPPTPVTGPHPTNKKLPGAGDTTVHVYGRPGDTVEVFLLKNSTGTVLQMTDVDDPDGKAITLEASKFVNRRTGSKAVSDKVLGPDGKPIHKPLSPGDVLLVRLADKAETSIPFSMFAIPRPNIATLTLAALAAGLEKSGADLTRGFRLNPDAVSLTAADLPLDRLSDGTLGRVFETGSVAAEEVSFLYSFDVGDTGREHQNRAIHNIAGLGIANGDRPSRPLAKPLVFEPRSSIRLQVEEISGPAGTLFIVLQGYKILGAGRIPG
jgi:hypothetical protein